MPPPASTLNVPAGTLAEVRSYRYEAQAPDGKRITGVIDANGPEWVGQQLATLQLRLIRLDPIGPASSELSAGTIPGKNHAATNESSPSLRPGRALSGDDFIAFNQQLAQLAKAGLPIESGLRLIAIDMRSGKLAQTVRIVADELDRGTPIEQAFNKYRDCFPSLYGRLLGAGVRSGDLAGVLLGLSAELELHQRLRSTLWRALSYPLTVMAALTVVLLLLSLFVLPRYRELYQGFSTGQVTEYSRSYGLYTHPIVPPDLPLPTLILFAVGRAVPYLAGVLAIAVVAAPAVWQFLRRSGRDRRVIDAFVLRLPFVGRPLRLCLVARWCNALSVGVSAGLPLPDAIALAGDTVRSPRLVADGQVLATRLERGLPLTNPGSAGGTAQDNPASGLSILPATVPVALELASGHNDLPGTLQSLADLYERQAEVRIHGIPAVLTPLMVIGVACCIGFVMLALIVPFVRLLDFLR
jgi:type II secretory pathway component PulF